MSQIDVVCYRPDVTAPTTPANLTATPSGTSILLACDVATDPAGAADEAITGVVGYRFYSALTQGGTYSALTTEATPGYTHVVGAVQTRWYKVGAVDYVGNVSTLSAAVGATTGGNQAPVWSAIGSQQLYIGSEYFLTLGDYVSDPESQPITITMTAGSLPVGLSFNAAAKRVEGTPTTAQQASATFSASDGFDATAQAVSFTVSVAPVIEFVAESGFTVTSSTGVFEHGALITIAGTGFGTKTQPAPWIVDIGTGAYIGGVLTSYGALTDGQILPQTVWNKIQQAGVGRPCSYWTSRPRRHARVAASYGTVAASPTDRNHKGVVGQPKWPTGWGTQNPQALYVAWYQKVKNPYLSAQGGEAEDKVFRLADTAGDGQGSNIVSFQGAAFSTVENPLGRRSFKNWPSSSNWQKFEVVLDTANGSADFYVDGAYQVQSASALGGEFEYRPLAKYLKSTNTPTGDTTFVPLSASPDPINNLTPNMIGYDDAGTTNNSDGQEIDFEEIYVDVTPQRVEIVDGEYTILAAQAREPCRPTAWSDTSISVVVNQGAFISLVGKSLYVTKDANGTRLKVGQFIEQDISAFNVTLNWSAPTTGDLNIAAYRVEWGRLANGGFGEFINSVRVDAPATSVSLELPPRGYAFRVVTIATDGEESQPYFLGTKMVDDPHVSLRPSILPPVPGWVAQGSIGLRAPHDLSEAGFKPVTPITSYGTTINIGADYAGGGFVASTNNRRYKLETDMVCNGTFAIEIRASNVLIDLNGHTITYFNTPGPVSGSSDFSKCGIWANVSASVQGNIEIVNGYIVQGDGDVTNTPTMGYGRGANAIRLDGLSNLGGKSVYYRGLYIRHHAKYAGAINHYNTSGPSVLVEYCTFVDSGDQVYTRANQQAVVAVNNYGNATEVRYCRVSGARHVGIEAKLVHHNEIWCDTKWTNGCGVLNNGMNAARFYNNNIYNTGCHPQGVFVRDTNNVWVYDNWIESMYTRTGRNYPAAVDTPDDIQNFATGITFKFGFDTNFRCYGNTILSYAKNDSVVRPSNGTLWDAEARGIYYYKGTGQTGLLNNQFYENLIVAINVDGAARAFTLGLSGLGGELTFHDNHLVSNWCVFWLSDEYTGELVRNLTFAQPECVIRNNYVERVESQSGYRTIKHGDTNNAGYPQDKITRCTFEANYWLGGLYPPTTQYISPGHTLTYISEPGTPP